MQGMQAVRTVVAGPTSPRGHLVATVGASEGFISGNRIFPDLGAVGACQASTQQPLAVELRPVLRKIGAAPNSFRHQRGAEAAPRTIEEVAATLDLAAALGGQQLGDGIGDLARLTHPGDVR